MFAMRISYTWLKEYLPLDLPVGDLATILTSLGLEVSGVEHVESVKGGLKGVVAGKVKACAKHPNADRLSLTQVDIGTGELLSIVCGAPNVRESQTVWVATVGTQLFPSGSEKSLTISKAIVRGEVSEGMICAEDELGLGTDHSGIMILPDDVAIGTLASAYYQVTADDVIDIDLTPNRSDAICLLGVAQDLAAWFTINKTSLNVRAPVVPAEIARTGDFPISVEVRNTEACPRYCGVTLSGIRVKASPKWLQDRLKTIDVRPINNIVDVTNFVLHEFGQPLHAFDADKITANKVIVQTLPEGTSFITLDEATHKLSSEDLMICDGIGNGMCIAGVYGGLGTGISDSTTKVFLESAHFHPRWVRRTALRHDLRTDAARTFEKSTDPNVCRTALIRAVDLIVNIAGGQVASEVIDNYPVPVNPAHVEVRWKSINRLTGVRLSKQKVKDILAALNMKIIKEDSENITVAIPTNKADVTREADVIEEILRIYGFDNVRMKPKMEIALTTTPGLTMSALRQDLGNFLAAHGFLEMMGMSLIESRQYEDGPLQNSRESRILIDNTSNIHLDMLRHNLLASALDALRFNQNRMQHDLMLFEFGRTYLKDESAFAEQERMTLTISGEPVSTGWRKLGATADFFFLKKYVHMILGHLGISTEEVLESKMSQWDYAREYRADAKQIVAFGSISQNVTRRYDLKNPVFFADFSMDSLLSLSSASTVRVTDIPKFPAVHRDIAIVLSKHIPYSKVKNTILQFSNQLLTNYNLFDIYENPEALGEDKRSLAIALIFQDPSRTLTDDEVNSAVRNIVAALEKDTGATLR